jgi:AcrR family transcriptional regulator
MKPRNPDQRSKIMSIAAHLFARQGYHGTSTREIARIADISENTLFRYFEHKEDLFWAALGESLSAMKPRKELLLSISEGAEPEIVLPQIFGQLVDGLIRDPEALNLIAAAFIERRWKAEAYCMEYLAPIFAAVRDYIAKGIERGRLRALDPSIVTAALMTTVLAHTKFWFLVGGGPLPYADSREAVQEFSKFWIALLAEKGQEYVPLVAGQGAVPKPASPDREAHEPASALDI